LGQSRKLGRPAGRGRNVAEETRITAYSPPKKTGGKRKKGLGVKTDRPAEAKPGNAEKKCTKKNLTESN